jgi:hypothetical protein
LPPPTGSPFDPYSQALYLFGGDAIFQIDPHHPTHVASSLTLPGTQLDNGTTDGRGHLFVASNFGQVVVVDVHRVGDSLTPAAVLHLHANLDDVAPLVGPGAASSAGDLWMGVVAAVLGLIFLVSSAVVIGPRLLARSRLPRWDLRRLEREVRPRRFGNPRR